MKSLYVVTRSDIDPGLQLAQSCHAVQAFNDQLPELVKSWEGNIRCLAAKDAGELGTLASDLSRQGFRLACFHEPDLEGALTAFAVHGAAERQLSHLPLALRPESRARSARRRRRAAA